MCKGQAIGMYVQLMLTYTLKHCPILWNEIPLAMHKHQIFAQLCFFKPHILSTTIISISLSLHLVLLAPISQPSLIYKQITILLPRSTHLSSYLYIGLQSPPLIICNCSLKFLSLCCISFIMKSQKIFAHRSLHPR